MKVIAGRGDLPTFHALCDELAVRKVKVKPSALLEIAAQCASSVYAPEYAKRVKRAARRRRLWSASIEVSAIAQDPAVTTEVAVSMSEGMISGLHDAVSTDSFVSTASDLVSLFTQRREIVLYGGDAGVPTGYLDLDRHLSGGFRGGQFCVIGGRPGMGKSAMLRDMARFMSSKGRVLYFSNEMSKTDLAARDIAVLSEVSLSVVAGATWAPHLNERIDLAQRALEFMPILTLADGALTSDDVRSWSYRIHHQEPIVAIVVDYMQRMADSGRTDLERVSKTARSLKAMAMELDVPVIAGSQLSRTTERENQDTRPSLIDLRNSGEIEQEADVVLLLYRTSYHYPTEETWTHAHKTGRYPGNEAEVAIAKQRQGVSGVTVKLLWVPTLATFRNLSRVQEGESESRF